MSNNSAFRAYPILGLALALALAVAFAGQPLVRIAKQEATAQFAQLQQWCVSPPAPAMDGGQLVSPHFPRIACFSVIAGAPRAADPIWAIDQAVSAIDPAIGDDFVAGLEERDAAHATRPWTALLVACVSSAVQRSPGFAAVQLSSLTGESLAPAECRIGSLADRAPSLGMTAFNAIPAAEASLWLRNGTYAIDTSDDVSDDVPMDGDLAANAENAEPTVAPEPTATVATVSFDPYGYNIYHWSDLRSPPFEMPSIRLSAGSPGAYPAAREMRPLSQAEIADAARRSVPALATALAPFTTLLLPAANEEATSLRQAIVNDGDAAMLLHLARLSGESAACRRVLLYHHFAQDGGAGVRWLNDVALTCGTDPLAAANDPTTAAVLLHAYRMVESGSADVSDVLATIRWPLGAQLASLAVQQRVELDACNVGRATVAEALAATFDRIAGDRLAIVDYANAAGSIDPTSAGVPLAVAFLANPVRHFAFGTETDGSELADGQPVVGQHPGARSTGLPAARWAFRPWDLLGR